MNICPSVLTPDAAPTSAVRLGWASHDNHVKLAFYKVEHRHVHASRKHTKQVGGVATCPLCTPRSPVWLTILENNPIEVRHFLAQRHFQMHQGIFFNDSSSVTCVRILDIFYVICRFSTCPGADTFGSYWCLYSESARTVFPNGCL